jgi:hypothetical protein
VAGHYNHKNKILEFNQIGKDSRLAMELSASQKGQCFMELLTYSYLKYSMSNQTDSKLS